MFFLHQKTLVLGVSMLVHLALWSTCRCLADDEARATTPPPASPTYYDLVLLDPIPEPSAEPEPPTPEQVVEQDDVQEPEQRPPAETKRISEEDRDVEHETRSRSWAGSSQPTPPPGRPEPVDPSPPLDPTGATKATRQVSTPSKPPGADGTLDLLEDVELGNRNRLDSRRSELASFINEARRAVAKEWAPLAVIAAHGGSGRWGSRRSTMVVVRIASDGSILGQVTLEESSGISVLDDEAIRAVKEAQMPRPPSLLLSPGKGYFELALYLVLTSNDREEIEARSRSGSRWGRAR